MIRNLLIMLTVLTLSSPCLADYAAGEEAYDRGDYSDAHDNWLASANQGDGAALLRLGQLYEQGKGVPQNFELAHVYYNLAAARGQVDAQQARDTLGDRMSPEWVARAQDRATSWRAQSEPEAEAGATAPAAGSVPAADLSWSGVNDASAAVQADQVQKLNKLLAEGTDPNVRLGNGDTLLLQAVRGGSLAAVQTLLNAGADPNARDGGGWTPLKAAIYGYRTDVARVLLRAGADPANLSPDGLTALALAQRLGQADMVALLSR